MADETGRTPGSWTLSKTESALQDQEAKSYELLSWRIEGNRDNLTDFKELPLNTFPKELKLTLASDPAPAGYSAIAGTPLPMMVGGKKTDVKAWRKQ